MLALCHARAAVPKLQRCSSCCAYTASAHASHKACTQHCSRKLRNATEAQQYVGEPCQVDQEYHAGQIMPQLI